MTNGYSQSPKLLKGALIRFDAATPIPVPNIIVFQYNPESVTRKLSPWYSKKDTDDPRIKDTLGEAYDPEETLSLKLWLDAADALEEPHTHPVAVLSGIADRIAAIEMLLYPTQSEGPLLKALNSLTGGPKVDVISRTKVPVVLFFWGPGRIVPVRITGFSVDEQAYSPTLYPIHAEATLDLRVLDAAMFDKDDKSAEVKIARACYLYTRGQKQALSAANLVNSFESMGLLPF